LSTLQFLLDPAMAPFTGAFALVAGLLVVEIVMSLLGASMMGGGHDHDIELDADIHVDIGGDIHLDVDMDMDIDAGLDADLDTGLDADFDAEIDADFGADVPDGADAPHVPSGIAGWLGFGEVPFIIWLAGILTAFGLCGYVLQLAAGNIFGFLLPVWAAIAVAVVPGVWLGRGFARTLGRLIPKTETSAISRRSLGDRRGIVVQGTARRGHPAQARVRDAFGNLHYVRIEPVDDGVEIPRGTEVLIRGGRGPVLMAIPISE